MSWQLSSDTAKCGNPVFIESQQDLDKFVKQQQEDPSKPIITSIEVDKWFGNDAVLAQIVTAFGTHLKSLDITRTEVTNLQPIANLTNLVQLFAGKTRISDDTGVKHLAKLTNLEVLSLEETDTKHLQPLANLKNLKQLALNQTKITGAELRHIANSSSGLHLLLLHDCSKIDDLQLLANLHSLTRLSLGRTGVDDSSLPHLIKLPLTALDLEDTEVTNDGLQYVGKIATLEDVVLAGTRITDEGLEHLKNSPALKSFHTYHTDVSDEAFENLQNHLRETQAKAAKKAEEEGQISKN